MQIKILPIKQLGRLLADIEGEIAAWPNAPLRQLSIIHDFHSRISGEYLNLAVLGQFKRGKSTLLNALIGVDVLPAAVTPLTAIPTFLSGGDRYVLRERRISGDEREIVTTNVTELARELSRRVTEDGNPHNKLGLTKVEVELPSALLGHGVRLVDTPGIGSTLIHNTKTTEDILPECDAALFVVSPDPPITEVEIDFLNKIRATTSRIIIVMNKIDLIDQGDLNIAISFLRRALADNVLSLADVQIFTVSARRALRARSSFDTDALAASGIIDLVKYLQNFIAVDKQTALVAAVGKKLAVIVGELVLSCDLRLEAYRKSEDELDRCIERFSHAANEFRKQHQIALAVLDNEQKRLLIEIDRRAGKMREEGLVVLVKELQEHDSLDSGNIQYERQLISKHVPAFFEAERTLLEKHLAQKLQAAFNEQAEQLFQIQTQIRRLASDLLGIEFTEPSKIDLIQNRHEPYWVESGQAPTIGPTSFNFFTWFMPRVARDFYMKRTLLSEIDTIVVRNVENLRWAERQNAEDAFRKFRDQVDQILEASLEIVSTALLQARVRRQTCSKTVREEIESMEKARSHMCVYRDQLLALIEDESKELRNRYLGPLDG